MRSSSNGSKGGGRSLHRWPDGRREYSCGHMIARAPVVMALAFLAACGGSSGSGGGPASPQAPSPGDSAEALPAGLLDPGTYYFEFPDFDVVFTVDDGWSSQDKITQASFGVVVGEEAEPPLQTVGVFITPEAAADVPGLIEGLDGVTVESQGDATLGGMAGTETVVSVGEDAREFIESSIGVGVPSQNRFVLYPGTRARIIVVDVDGQALVLLAEAPEAEYAEFEPKAQGVIDSVQIQAR
jgi:hypothetical protein